MKSFFRFACASRPEDACIERLITKAWRRCERDFAHFRRVLLGIVTFLVLPATESSKAPLTNPIIIQNIRIFASLHFVEV